MNIVKIGGGIGNQLFQYALARSLQISYGMEVKLDSSSWFDEFKEREYKLGNFGTIQNLATKKEIGGLKKYKRIGGRLNVLHNIFVADKTIYIMEKQFNFDPDIMVFRKNSYLDGVWHSEKYFKKIESHIRKEIILKNKPSNYFSEIAIKMSGIESVSLHFRRGDYLTMPKAIDRIGVCPIEYYNLAVTEIKKTVSNPTFFVFSDDIEWVKQNFNIKSPTIFVSDGNMPDYEELILMGKCRHNITANSSFSWWGAWLNENPKKIVITPKKWFRDTSIDTRDIVPESWLRI